MASLHDLHTGGADYDTEEEWCIAKYNQTNCEEIRQSAQQKWNTWGRTVSLKGLPGELDPNVSDSYHPFGFTPQFYTCNGIWGLFVVVLLWVTLCILQAIISLPIVQRSKESNIPLWVSNETRARMYAFLLNTGTHDGFDFQLSVPIAGSYAIGYVLLEAETSVTAELREVALMAFTYIGSGSGFALAAMVGVGLKFITVLNSRSVPVCSSV